MNTKLTLRLDKQLIRSAKEYAARTGKPVSRIVADLFEVIRNEKFKDNTVETPAVNSLRGVLKGGSVSEDDYGKHLEEKYS
jgi:hypothetical protein